MKLGIIQLAANPDDRCTLERASRLIDDAAESDAEVIVLPELFRWSYPGQCIDASLLDRAEPLDGPTVQAMASAAVNNGVVICVPLMERRGPGLVANSVVVLGPDGGQLGVYRKAHIPDDPHFHEKYYFAPGDEAVCVIETPFGRVGVLICWDQWFPEAARLATLAGAEVVVYPTAIGSISGESTEDAALQLDAWQTVQRGHAIANGIYLAAVNRVGAEQDIAFWGHSFVVDPFGRVVADLDRHGDQFVVVDISGERIEDVRRTWPFLRDRRTELYGALGKRWNG